MIFHLAEKTFFFSAWHTGLFRKSVQKRLEGHSKSCRTGLFIL